MNAPGGDSVALNLLVDDKGTLQKIEGSVGQVRQQFVEAEKHAEGFRARMMVLRNTLRDLALEGKTNTDEYKGMAKELGRMDEAMKRVAMSQNLLNPERKAAAFGAMARTVGEGFHAAAAAAILFAGKNEQLEKIIMKTMQLQAIANGIQAVVEGRKQVAILATLLLKKKETAATLEGVAATEAEGAAVGKLTIFQKIFNAVASLNPIGLIITAVVTLTAIIIGLYNAFKPVKTIIDNMLAPIIALGKAIGQFFGLVQSDAAEAAGQMKLITDEIERQNEILSDQIRIMKAKGASSTAVHNAEINLIYRKMQAYADEINAIKAAALADGKLTEEQSKRLNELRALYTKGAADALEKQKEFDDKIAKERDDARKKAMEDAANARKQEMDAIRKSQEDADRKFEEYKAKQKKQAEELATLKIKNIQDEHTRTLTEAKAGYEKELEAAGDNADLKEQIEIEYAQKVSDIQNKFADEQEKAREERVKKEIEADTKIRDAKISIAESMVKGLTALGDLLTQNGKKNQGFAKILALAQIGIDEAKAIGSLVAGSQAAAAHAAIVTGGLGAIEGIAYYASGFASILSGVAAAKAALNGSETSGSTAPTGLGGNAGAAITAPIQSQRTMLDEAQRRRSYNTVYKTYVVASDMTKAQATEEKLKTRRIH